MSLSVDALFKLAKQRAAEEEAKPLEQRRREYREKHAARWETSEEGKLCLEFYRAYTAYKEHLRAHMRDWREGNDTPLEFEEHQAFQDMARAMAAYQKQREETDKRNLEKAKLAARCAHRRAGGEYCGSPRMKGSKYCYGHERLMAARTQDLELRAAGRRQCHCAEPDQRIECNDERPDGPEVGRDVFLRHADCSQRDGASEIWRAGKSYR